MAPFFMDVWMEMASENQASAEVKTEKKTLFFIPSNDDIKNRPDWHEQKDDVTTDISSKK